MSKELTPIEALEKLKVTFNSLIESNEFVNNDISIIEKSLKALEVIKKKEVYVNLLFICKGLDEYNWCICQKERALTKEEYDLLKEVML